MVDVVELDANYGNDKPIVVVANDDDSFYWQGFQTRAEIDRFIDALTEARDAAFPDTP